MLSLLTVMIVGAVAQDKVAVNFYGEALCPFCKAFLSGPLNQTLSAQGVAGIMDFNYLPFGNAYFITKECGGKSGEYDHTVRSCWDQKCGGDSAPEDCYTGELVCQHGPTECFGNFAEQCAITMYPDPLKYMPFAYCLEITNTPSAAAVTSCATSLGLDAAGINRCAANDQGKALNVQFGKRTAALPGGHPGVPWVTVNGTPDQNLDNGFLKLVCDTYKGTKPPGCNGLNFQRMSI